MASISALKRISFSGIRLGIRNMSGASKEVLTGQALLDANAAEAAHAAKSGEFWRKVTVWFCLPVCVAVAWNAYKMEMEHLSHPRPEFVPYDHMYIRRSPFPWGDGNHSLFHHPEHNALPEGYET